MPGRLLLVRSALAGAADLEAQLRGAGFQVECAASVPAAEGCLRSRRPDLLLLDADTTLAAGLGLVRRLRGDARTREAALLVIGSVGDEAEAVRWLDAGADDFVSRQVGARELVSRLNAVLRRRAPHCAEEVCEIAGLRIDPSTQAVTAHGQRVELWATELRLLHFLMAHPGRVFSRARLLDEVWGEHVFVEERTVDVHIRRLRQSLEPSGHDQLVETVRGSGYRMRSELPAEGKDLRSPTGAGAGVGAA